MLYEFKDQIHRLIPMRCQICGSWGHFYSGTKWICDACLAKLFDQKRISVSPETKEYIQISLF